MEEMQFLPLDRLAWCLALGILTVLATVAVSEVIEFLLGILRTIVALVFSLPNRTADTAGAAKGN